MHKFLKILASILICASAVFAQDEIPTHVTNQNRTGDLPYTSTVGTDIEHVDLASGALSVHIPLWSVPGRGMNTELSFHWNSNYLMAAQRTDASGNPFFVYQIAKNSGWQTNHPLMTFAANSTPCDQTVQTAKWKSHYIYYDEEGGKHPLAVETGGAITSCLPPGTTTNPDLTDSGMMGSLTGVTLADGTVVTTGNSASFTSTYKDANGNTRSVEMPFTAGQFTTAVDTLGRSIITETDAPFDLVGRPTQTTYAVKDANGVSQNIVVVWAALNITTNFATPGVAQELAGKEWWAIQSITLPNGTSYQFHYEPDYGELTEIDLPTGGVIKYTWANYTYPNPAAPTPLDESRRYVASRTETVNGASNTWYFQLTNISSTQQDQDTATFPATMNSAGAMVSNQSVFLSQYGNLLDVKLYAGSVGDTPVREYSMNYALEADPTAYDACTDAVTFGLPASARLTRIITVLDDGTATKKEFDYDSLTYTYYPNHCGDNSGTTTASGGATSRGNVTAIREYGFGSSLTGTVGTNRDVVGAQLLRTTSRTYLYASVPAYATANIVSKVLSETITDNVANVTAAQTQFDYDQTPILATTNLASVPGHDSTFTSSFTVRGNPTHVNRLNNATGTLLSTAYAYDDLGNLRTITDPKLNATNWFYDDSFDSASNNCAPASGSFAYVTKKTDAASHNFFVKHRSCTGQVHSHQDDNDVANGVSTSYTYDSMNRVLVKTLPNSGTITTDYHGDPAPPLITTTTTASPDPSIIQDQQFDGLKRVVQTVMHAPECNEVVDTGYDALGRKTSVSNPHCIAITAPTDGTTTTIYDAISRPVKVAKQDSSVVGTSYSILHPLAGVSFLSTAVTDESGRVRTSLTDALGHMVEVDEEATHQIPAQPASPATAGHGSITISGTEQSQQVQTVPATPGTASFTVSGAEKHVQAPDCPLHQSCPIFDAGGISVTVNGVSAAVSYGQSLNATNVGMATALTNAINTRAGMPVTATVSGTTVTISSANGSNYSFSIVVSYDTEDFTSPSFTVTPSSGTMTGGSPAQFGPSYDTGTVSIILNGTTYSTTTGQTSTPTNIASGLAASMNGALVTATSAPCSPVTSTCGAIISISAKAQGVSTNYSLSASSTSTLHSFTATASGAALTGGADATPAVPAHTAWTGVWITKYNYDVLGNLYCVEQHGDATGGTPCPATPYLVTQAPISPDTSNPWRLRRFGYNSLGQLLWASNPESGIIQYAYDPDGNLSVKTSPAANQTASATTAISYCYDKVNRLTAKGYSNSPSAAQQCTSTSPYLPTPAVVLAYDAGLNGIGRLTSFTDQAGSGAYAYDSIGEIKTEQRTIGTVTKSMSYDYDQHGGVTALHYPSGAVITYTNQSAGRPTSAIDTVNSINYVTGSSGSGSYVQYGPDGSIATFTNGYTASFAGIKNAFFNNTRLQPCRLTSTTGTLPLNCGDTTNQGNILDLGYDFHSGNGDNGNVFTLTNFKDSTRTQSFGYDSVNRLTSAQNAGTDCSVTARGTTKFWGNSYSFDEWGNLYNKTVTKCTSEYLNTTVDVQNRLHGSGTDYQYDAAGNMTNDQTDFLTSVFDQENRISTATKSGVATAYTYDGDSNRVKKTTGTNGTLYWYMAPGIVAESDLSGTLSAEYVFFGGRRMARKDLPANTIAYYFSDYLKSAAVITDAAGTIKLESDFMPWGGERLQSGGGDPNHYKFTGKERDTETQLDYFGARYYSNGLGRFITPDWAAKAAAVPYAELADPQSLNLFSYVRNRPTVMVDPDGHDGQDLSPPSCGGAKGCELKVDPQEQTSSQGDINSTVIVDKTAVTATTTNGNTTTVTSAIVVTTITSIPGAGTTYQQQVVDLSTQVINNTTGAEVSKTDKQTGAQKDISHGEAEKNLSKTGGINQAQQRALMGQNAKILSQMQQQQQQASQRKEETNSTFRDFMISVVANAFWEALKVSFEL